MVKVKRSTLIRPLVDFFAAETASGIVVVLGAIAALIWANSPWSQSYVDVWSTKLGASLGGQMFSLDLRHWVNDGLMTIFFLVVGLEIKRELVDGELRDVRKAVTPFAAALGGMVVPALIFWSITAGRLEQKAWGMPIATDIALALGVLALAGPRVPSGAKLFLLALAIVDDIGAILVIALFYAKKGDRSYLILAVAAVLVTLLLKRLEVVSFLPYVGLGIVLWFALHEAGVHATIAGVIMGLLAPTSPMERDDVIDANDLADHMELHAIDQAFAAVKQARSSVSVVEWLEHRLHSWSSFIIVPLFAIANAGVSISGTSLSDSMSTRVFWAVGLGLLLGKPIGIMLATFAVVKLKLGALPEETSWGWIGITGIVAGIGFTVSLFVAELALGNPELDNAKIGILAASIVAGVIGLIGANRLGRTQAAGVD